MWSSRGASATRLGHAQETVDYYLQPKIAYYHLRRAYEPVTGLFNRGGFRGGESPPAKLPYQIDSILPVGHNP